MSRISKRLLSLAGIAVLSLGALVLMMPAPAGAEGPGFSEGLKPPAYKYSSQYESLSGLYLNLGSGAYARVPTIRLRVGAVKAREVQAANVRGISHFMPSVGHFVVGSSNTEARVVLPIKPRYSYNRYSYNRYSYKRYGYGRYGYGGPGYGQPFYGQPGYGQYGFNTGQALQGLSNARPQTAYVGSFNKPKQVIGYNLAGQQGPKPHFIHINGATAKNGAMPIVHKPAGKHLIRVE
jgi:hypothetical protein